MQIPCLPVEFKEHLHAKHLFCKSICSSLNFRLIVLISMNKWMLYCLRPWGYYMLVFKTSNSRETVWSINQFFSQLDNFIFNRLEAAKVMLLWNLNVMKLLRSLQIPWTTISSMKSSWNVSMREVWYAKESLSVTIPWWLVTFPKFRLTLKGKSLLLWKFSPDLLVTYPFLPHKALLPSLHSLTPDLFVY